VREAAGSEDRRTVPGEIHILSLLCFVVTSGVGGRSRGEAEEHIRAMRVRGTTDRVLAGAVSRTRSVPSLKSGKEQFFQKGCWRTGSHRVKLCAYFGKGLL